ncbi:hypothetical protein JDV02_009195 [Purpureocillium takamizusanense]|uniref:Uncharacterized protein n=1 Tax=Purpureocillium takamizusanense TaxID=2060973 RepID=A0A9Q8QR66_9HYPO|nr:uncharacterized protein JDV02_009195 [Purpureocillium takamizusanense]UNI23371.1 hypothetical protein JDV02_009195 [Purpureocillium takamizusanense]
MPQSAGLPPVFFVRQHQCSRQPLRNNTIVLDCEQQHRGQAEILTAVVPCPTPKAFCLDPEPPYEAESRCPAVHPPTLACAQQSSTTSWFTSNGWPPWQSNAV